MDKPTGFMIGIVTNCDDPKDWGRVKVKFPVLSDQKESDWARVVTVGGGITRGFQWIPDVNDEVLVGFEQGDIHHPYVLGGLWNGVDPPYKKKGDYLEGGHVVRRYIHTNKEKAAKGNTITLDDSSSSPSITIEDAQGNIVHIDTKTNKLEIHIKGDIEIKGKNIKLTGEQEINIKAPMINIG
jgi:uncharacterized protein involved in type VI secretion and phage assembly